MDKKMMSSIAELFKIPLERVELAANYGELHTFITIDEFLRFKHHNLAYEYLKNELIDVVKEGTKGALKYGSVEDYVIVRSGARRLESGRIVYIEDLNMML